MMPWCEPGSTGTNAFTEWAVDPRLNHGDFNAVWSEMRRMRDSGRWDVQCHSYVGHVLMPIDAQDGTGIFLANRLVKVRGTP